MSHTSCPSQFSGDISHQHLLWTRKVGEVYCIHSKGPRLHYASPEIFSWMNVAKPCIFVAVLILSKKGTSTRKTDQNHERNSDPIMLSRPKLTSGLVSLIWSAGIRIRLEKRFFTRRFPASLSVSASASGASAADRY